ncbi:CPBP family intramembrane glutamic endopeptidase [Halorhabdus amylolytica]|uniref:CPBP family intramembrane glutamic endopeptidase n=1 Tax=Halorhabdus amylolytica TaxID=2559573 RepID=UPI0020BFF2FB|nr:CPBP family intramembrane glutamic endopeptidase [Halorhabdus amylolytica]
MVNIALTQGLVAIVVLVGAWYFDVPLRALGIAGDSPIVAVATGLALGLVLWLASEVTTALSEAAGFGADEGLRRLLAPGTTGGWIALLGFALPIVAVSEELLFRAAAIGVPATGSGTSPWALSIVSSVAFGFCHGIQGRAGVLVTGVLGFVLAAAYVYTGSLLVVIVAHYVLNATEFLVHEGLGVDPIGT